MKLKDLLLEGINPDDYNGMFKRLNKMSSYREILWDYIEEHFNIKSVNRRKEDLEIVIEDLTDKQIEELINKTYK